MLDFKIQQILISLKEYYPSLLSPSSNPDLLSTARQAYS
jgi:hypothetical protein